jgi:hypothetical protein
MPPPTDNDPIRQSCDHWVEFTDTAINLTGIPDDQFRSVDDDGNPVVETESMDHPLIEFDDLPLGTSDGPEDEGVPPGDQIPSPGANGTAHPPVPRGVPPKSD